ncbi:sterol desaturase family protein [Shimia sp.]|uniref:sterol desaturase family protein n=1 Tax=Shimia sp. TaxID=1954381 RepID=UPI003BAA66B4
MPVFIFAFGSTVDLYTVVGVSVLVFVFHVTGSNLRHSHIIIRYWSWMERVLISPAQHQLHHSTAERHFDKNFGAALAIWDWLFGSLYLSEQEEELTFGLPPEEASATNLLDIYFRPLSDTWRYFKRSSKKVVKLLRTPQKKTK